MTEAEIISMVSDLGTAQDILEGDPSSPLAKLLQDMMQEVTDQLVSSLAQYDAVASGNLMQSIQPSATAELDGDILSVSISAPFYWKFVNYGVNGTEVNRGAPAWGTVPQDRSFHASIMDWVRNRGISLPKQFGTYDSFAWAVMKSIQKKGIEKRPFFTDVVNDKLYDYFQESISTLIGRAITVKIVEPWQ